MTRAQGGHGRRSRPGRGLSLDRIVTATLELVDEQGIGAASMRAVSSRLGVRSMSLYRYVRDRDELFDAVVERIVGELGDDPEVQLRPVDGWRPYLAGTAHGVRRYARAHPHAFPLVATRPPAAPWVNPPLRSLRWVEAMLTGLAREGFSDEQVLFTYCTFNSFLRGYLLLAVTTCRRRATRGSGGGGAGEGWMKETERRRRQFIRAHHPDRGGDAGTFIAGMRAFDAEQAPSRPPPRVVVVRRPSWPARLVTAAARRLGHGRKPPRVR